MPTYFILVSSTLQQLLSTEDDCLTKAQPYHSPVMWGDDAVVPCRTMKDILADTCKEGN
ncbi:hypothetical protein DPMN_142752 [Dreissena polymorpha]|uniref:Uncharacterized protein n=1 Tax=Dreissena polymorpha TaxID=45954 RepID=A0A9D4GF38_DREPO|nr:hypothetical protein DPMN_142752 [Dreissena polymorpha]